MAAATSSNSNAPKPHRCNICGRTFETAELLKSHHTMDHGNNSHPPAGVS